MRRIQQAAEGAVAAEEIDFSNSLFGNSAISYLEMCYLQQKLENDCGIQDDHSSITGCNWQTKIAASQADMEIAELQISGVAKFGF